MNGLLLLPLLIAMHLHNGHRAEYSGALPALPQVANVVTPGPTIESILHNPEVDKKEMARHVVQAVGYHPAGDAHFIIHFRKQELHGNWQSFYSNGRRADSGALYRNLPDGEWKTWYPNGQVKSIRNYSAEKYQYIKADLQRNHPKDQRYTITRLGSVAAAPYFQPQYEPHKNRQALSLLQKIQHNTAENEDYVPPFTSCLHHGVFMNYDVTGAVKDSGQYVNGVPHGLWHETVADSGLQGFGFYHYGVKHGPWKYYDSAGRLVYTERYKANGHRTDIHYFEK